MKKATVKFLTTAISTVITITTVLALIPWDMYDYDSANNTQIAAESDFDARVDALKNKFGSLILNRDQYIAYLERTGQAADEDYLDQIDSLEKEIDELNGALVTSETDARAVMADYQKLVDEYNRLKAYTDELLAKCIEMEDLDLKELEGWADEQTTYTWDESEESGDVSAEDRAKMCSVEEGENEYGYWESTLIPAVTHVEIIPDTDEEITVVDEEACYKDEWVWFNADHSAVDFQ